MACGTRTLLAARLRDKYDERMRLSLCSFEPQDVYERRDYTLAGIVSHARYCSYCGARVVSGNDAS